LGFLSFDGVITGQSSGPAGMQSVGFFLFAMFLAHFFSLLFAWYLYKTKASIKTHGKLVVFLALFFCLVASLGSAPWLDDDIYRYMWDGYVSSIGQNVIYSNPENIVLLDTTLFPKKTYDLISYKNVATVYPPVAQSFFEFSWIRFGDRVQGWAGISSILYILSVIVIHRIVIFKKIPVFIFCLLALNPTFIKEFADTAHVDILGFFLLMMGILIHLKTPVGSKRWLHASLSAVLFTLAVLVKPVALLVLPFLSFKNKTLLFFTAILTTVFSSVGMYLSYNSPEDIKYFISALKYFSDHWIFNPSVLDSFAEIHQIVLKSSKYDSMIWGAKISKYLSYSIFFVCIILSLFKDHAKILFAVCGLTGFYFLNPVINTWYLIWIMPAIILLPWHKNLKLSCLVAAPAYLMTILSLSGYLYWIALEDFTLTRRLIWLGWLIVTVVISKTVLGLNRSAKKLQRVTSEHENS